MLNIDWGLLAVTLVLFLALIFVLNQILYKPLLKHIDSRNAKIAADEQGASQNSSDISSYKIKAEQIIAEARSAANAKKQAAIARAKEEAASKIEAAKSSLDAEFAEFMATLDETKSELKDGLAAKMPELKTALASKVAKI